MTSNIHKIVSVNFVEFYSNLVSENQLRDFLIESRCNSKGKLKLVLESGRKLKQEGPFILPPIRWLESFEYNAEFNIICDVQ